MFKRGYISQIAASLMLMGSASLCLAQAPTEPSPDWEAWRVSMSLTPLPGSGCFKAAYPATEWRAVACVTAPLRPFGQPPSDSRALTVGNGADWSAKVSGLISTSAGSFNKVTGVKRIRDPQAPIFSLQLNSNFFTTSVCNGAANPSQCLGWQQFVLSDPGYLFMQYWLINYGNRCPSGWSTYQSDCYRNSNSTSVPRQTPKDLAGLILTGVASGGQDKAMLATKGGDLSAVGEDTVVNLEKGWNTSEFNVFGNGGGTSVKFNKGSALTVRISVDDGSSSAPACVKDGFSGETNNLTLGTCTASGGSSPAIVFEESN